MPASLNMPPRHSREHFEALASEPLFDTIPLTQEDRIFLGWVFGLIAIIWVAGFSALFVGA